ncbi:MAG: hypothetical protein RBR39_12420, partial [Proteiniphilum sp.]|nr:hypothetical protein [Proteiniphilum sp.]
MQFKELSGIIIPMTLPRSLFIFLFGQGRALPILSYFRNIMQFKELSGIIIPMTLPRSLFIFLFGQGRALP